MRIFIIFAVNFDRGFPATGGEINLYDTAKGLEKQNVGVAIVDQYSLPLSFLKSRLFRRPLFQLRILRFFLKGLFGWKTLLVLSHEDDIIKRLWWVSLVGNFFKVRTILWPQLEVEITEARKQGLRHNILLNNLAGATTVSKQLKDLAAQEWKLANNKVFLIPPMHNMELSRRLSQVQRNVSCNSPVRLLCVANVMERKGFDQLFQALPSIPRPFLLTIAGDPHKEPSFTKKLKTFAKEKGFEDSLHFAGWVDDEALYNLYKESDIFVLLSNSESYGIAVFDAALCALPMLLSHGANPVKVFEHDKSGIIISPKEVNAISTGLARLIKDETVRTKLGKEARRAAQNAMKESPIHLFKNMAMDLLTTPRQ